MPTSAASALTNKLFQVITGGNGVPPGSFISFVGGGIPLDAAHLSWAAKVPPYVGCQDADNAYAFSTLVNTIPTAAGPWAAGSANMAKAFRDIWLMNAEVPNIPLTPAQVTERDTAQTLVDQKYDAYTQYQNDWANANMMFQLATLAPRDAQYFQNLLLARSQVTAALTAWQAKGAKAEKGKKGGDKDKGAEHSCKGDKGGAKSCKGDKAGGEHSCKGDKGGAKSCGAKSCGGK